MHMGASAGIYPLFSRLSCAIFYNGGTPNLRETGYLAHSVPELFSVWLSSVSSDLIMVTSLKFQTTHLKTCFLGHLYMDTPVCPISLIVFLRRVGSGDLEPELSKKTMSFGGLGQYHCVQKCTPVARQGGPGSILCKIMFLSNNIFP